MRKRILDRVVAVELGPEDLAKAQGGCGTLDFTTSGPQDKHDDCADDIIEL